MAGGVMGQVQGLIPGMKREEDVPDPAPQAEGEYQEYAVSAFFLNDEKFPIFITELWNQIFELLGMQRAVIIASYFDESPELELDYMNGWHSEYSLTIWQPGSQ